MAQTSTSTTVDASGSGGGRIELISLSKSFDDQLVLKAIDLVVEAGEFFCLLGPSGCGKTTTLRLIGGFEGADGGSVLIDGADIGGMPPEKRPVNTVFQSYALFPHMTVADNVGFGLRFNDVPKAERSQRISEALDLVQLSEYASRKPHQLSGGQQQRVALARALILRPRVLLLDEPLGALDAKLRRALQFELKALHREVGITFVYVTHDQEEALTMSDRLAVMREGEIEQIGTPRDVYQSPSSTYVADFLGLANLLDGAVVGPGMVEVAGHRLAADTGSFDARCTLFVRPERVRLASTSAGTGDGAGDGRGDQRLEGTVADVVFVGSVSHANVDTVAGRVQAVVPNDGSSWIPSAGDRVALDIAPDAIRLLEP